MLVESPIGRLDENESPNVDWLDLTWSDCATRALRKTTRSGQPIRLLLRLGTLLSHRDILWRSTDGRQTIAVNITPCDVLILSPKDKTQFAAAAFELGNIHMAIQLLDDGKLATTVDGPTIAICEKYSIPFEIQTRRFEPTFRGTVTLAVADDLSLLRKT